MARASDPELLILTALRLKSFAPAEVVAASARLQVTDVDARLDDLRERGLARHREGAITGWLLTPEGRARGQQLLATELDDTGARRVVQAAYEQFLGLNPELLELCTDWQLFGGQASQQLNDHADPDYDAAVISRLAVLHDKVRPVLVDLAAALERFDGYETRFAAALARVQGGAPAGDDWADWFTKPTIDSFHTVWFELHENLLATLGIDRSSEAQP
jgi:hypothetical protein